MIEVSHLSKSYRDLKAVDDVSFQVQSGEILGFLGPNGAGKTTTMRILTGVLPPTSGAVKVAGFDVFEQPLEVKKRIGYLPENPPVYTDMTVRAYLRWRGDRYRKAHPDAPPPRQLILLMRRYAIVAPGDAPPYWRGPFTVPVARLWPDAPGSADGTLEMFNPVTQRYQEVSR